MPAIRLGGDAQPWPGDGRAPTARLRSKQVEVGGVPTRAVSSAGEGVPAVFLHGWLDNADTWLSVLDRLSVAGRTGIAYDLPGFGTAPPLGDGSVLDQLVDFVAAAVTDAAEAAGRKVVVVGNSLGGWVALRLAELSDLPLAGVVPIGPAGIRMAPLFFTLDRMPAVSRIISVPAPVPPAMVRGVAGRLYRTLAFADPAGVDKSVVDRFTRFHVERPVIRERLEYAKRLRPELDDPFDADADPLPRNRDLGRRRPALHGRGRGRPRRGAPPGADRDPARRRAHAADRGARGRRGSARRARRLAGLRTSSALPTALRTSVALPAGAEHLRGPGRAPPPSVGRIDDLSVVEFGPGKSQSSLRASPRSSASWAAARRLGARSSHASIRSSRSSSGSACSSATRMYGWS